jgi:hypothetical protein
MNASAGYLLLIFDVTCKTELPKAAAYVLGGGRRARAQFFQEILYHFIGIGVVILHHWHQLKIFQAFKIFTDNTHFFKIFIIFLTH